MDEQQIRDLCRGLDNVNVLRVDSASSSSLQQIINQLPNSAPRLQGNHAPSTWKAVEGLDHITFDQLKQDERHTNTALHVVVADVKYKNGALISVKDENGTSGIVWSLLLRPFGVAIEEGMRLAIKEPYFGRCPTGDLAVCVHHADDCIHTSPSGSDKSSLWKPTCSKNHITVRESSLSGRGVFATAPVGAGSLVLLEKALALPAGSDAGAYGYGLDGVLEGERTNGRKLSLLQQLVDKVHGDKSLRKDFFDLHAGESFPVIPEGFSITFDSYRALAIIKHNAHTVFPGSTSDHHDIANNKSRPTNLSSQDQVPGIWLQASMFNHSCLPNCAWAWTGDLFVARANRDIAADEELTVAYVPSSYDYQKRQGILRASNGFECSCPLCKADEAVARTPEVQEALTKAQRLPQHVRGSSLKERVQSAEEIVRLALEAYPCSNYADTEGIELPCIQLAEPFYHLAHVVLDRAKNGFDWKATPLAARQKAQKYFTACVEVGLGYRLVLDPSSSYCELLCLKYSQPRPIGVLSLMALAELAFIDGDKSRCRALKACAKKLYGIWYGEDASFKKHHLYYSCKDEPAERGKPPATTEWEELNAGKIMESKSAPSFD